jgi:hypothetical protein
MRTLGRLRGDVEMVVVSAMVFVVESIETQKNEWSQKNDLTVTPVYYDRTVLVFGQPHRDSKDTADGWPRVDLELTRRCLHSLRAIRSLSKCRRPHCNER